MDENLGAGDNISDCIFFERKKEMRYDPPILATPEEIEQVAIGIILAKASRAKKAMRRYKLMHRKAERRMEPVVKEWLDWTAKILRAGLSRMKGKTAGAKAKSIADWDEIRARGEELLKPVLFETLAEGGNSVMGQRIRKQERFDPIGVEAVNWTTKHSAELVVEITDKTMLAIREYITAGINAGKSIQAIAMELRPLVGLTSKDMMAVANYHEMLILERPEYTAATQRQMADTYAGRLHRRRATTIARTETAFSLTEGQRQGYGQMGVKKLERVEDPAAEDDDCVENNGRVYTLAEAEGVLPAHPNCEGTWVIAG